MAEQTPTQEQPVLPPTPWYESPVQVRLVSAGLAQVISFGFRLVEAFGYKIELGAIQNVDQLAADGTQVLAFGFIAWAWWKRQRSAVQPLTFTKQAAQSKAETSIVDPTTMTKRGG